MNDVFDIIHTTRAMRRLKNGKVPGPTTGIPNELVKYGGAPMARLLQPLSPWWLL